jgi:hypothetical protein
VDVEWDSISRVLQWRITPEYSSSYMVYKIKFNNQPRPVMNLEDRRIEDDECYNREWGWVVPFEWEALPH